MFNYLESLMDRFRRRHDDDFDRVSEFLSTKMPSDQFSHLTLIEKNICRYFFLVTDIDDRELRAATFLNQPNPYYDYDCIWELGGDLSIRTRLLASEINMVTSIARLDGGPEPVDYSCFKCVSDISLAASFAIFVAVYLLDKTYINFRRCEVMLTQMMLHCDMDEYHRNISVNILHDIKGMLVQTFDRDEVLQ